MSANARQVGGSHYRKKYQHWDWVADTKQPYHIGCTTKYLSRYLEKNGLQDLEKAGHYLEKAIELDIRMPYCGSSFVEEFTSQFTGPEADIMTDILADDLECALESIKALIIAHKSQGGPVASMSDSRPDYLDGEPGPGYVNQG